MEEEAAQQARCWVCDLDYLRFVMFFALTWVVIPAIYQIPLYIYESEQAFWQEKDKAAGGADSAPPTPYSPHQKMGKQAELDYMVQHMHRMLHTYLESFKEMDGVTKFFI